MSNLAEDGFPAIEMRQGWVTMAPAVKELERAIIAGRFRHGGHPVLRWNFDNIAVETASARGAWVVNVPDYCVEEVSDHAVTLLLDHWRGVTALDRESKRGLVLTALIAVTASAP